MAPTQDMWLAFLGELERRPASDGLLVDFLRDTLMAVLAAMPAEGWAERVERSHRLTAVTPSMSAHGLQFCDRTTRASVAVLRERFGFAADDLRPRLALDLGVAAFHCALEEWTFRPGPTDRDDLVERLRRAFAAVPGAVTLALPPG